MKKNKDILLFLLVIVIIAISLFVLFGCERTSNCLNCKEIYYAELFGIYVQYYDTTYVECYEHEVFPFKTSEKTIDTKGYVFNPFCTLKTIKICKIN